MTPDELKALANSLDAARDYADEIVKPSLSELGGLLSDTVGYWRLKNRVRILTKAKAFLEAEGVSPQKVLPDVFVPLLEAAGNTEDKTLSDMFARLLATHLDPAKQDTVHPSFAKTLGQFSSLDAQVLNLIDKAEEEHRVVKKDCGYIADEDVVLDEMKARYPDVGVVQFRLSLENLERLGILEDMSFRYRKYAGPTRCPKRIVTRYGGRLLAAISAGTSWRTNHEEYEEAGYYLSKKPITEANMLAMKRALDRAQARKAAAGGQTA